MTSGIDEIFHMRRTRSIRNRRFKRGCWRKVGAVLEYMNCNLKSRKVARVPMLFLNPEKPFKLRSLKTMFKRLSLTIKRNLMQEKVPFFKTGFLACRAMKKGSDLSTRLGRLRRKFPPGIRFNALLRRNVPAVQQLDKRNSFCRSRRRCEFSKKRTKNGGKSCV